MRLLFVLLIMTLISSSSMLGQCMTYSVSIEEKEENAEIIVLGKPSTQYSYWDEDHHRIYTLHIIEVQAFFKGNNGAQEIGVITTGGKVGLDVLQVHPSFDIYPYNEYIFFLKGDNGIIDHKEIRSKHPELIQSETYADAQGAITKQFGQYSELHNPNKYNEEAQFERIAQLTKQVVKTPKGKIFKPRLAESIATKKEDLADFEQNQTIVKDLNTNPSLSLLPISTMTPNPTYGGTVNSSNYLTITGSGFGAEATVFYSNADDGGQTFVGSTSSSDNVSWSSTSIQEKVNQNAGTGPIQVNGQISSSDLQVDWSHNCIYETFTGFSEITRQRFFLVDMNDEGGYTFRYNTNFKNNSSAKAAFERALESWRCGTYMNWQVSSSSTSTSSAANDNINLVTFNSSLAAGILGRSYSYYSGTGTGVCNQSNTVWWTREMDIEFDSPPTNGATWNFGPSPSVQFNTTYDFESVVLHELGHLHGLGHTIDGDNDVMHHVLSNGTDKRVLSTEDIDGGDAKMAYSTDEDEYCYFPNNFNGEMIALTSSNCSLTGGCSTIAVNITGENSFCEQQTAELNAGSYSSDDSYDWSNGFTSQIINVSSPGTYTVIVTDVNDCTGSDSFTVVENTAPQPSIVGALTICPGESTGLSSGNIFNSYLWSTNASSFSILVETTGIYTLTVTSSNGCTGTDQVTVVENTPPQPQITGAIGICPDEETTLSAGSGFQSYLWSTSANSAQITVDTGGTYSVTVTGANDCSGTDEYLLIDYNTPNPTIGGDTFFCNGGETVLSVEENFATVAWSNGASSNEITVSQNGIYTVTVTNTNNCTGTSEVFVEEGFAIFPNVTGNLEICSGVSTTLTTGSGYATYNWSTGSISQEITVDEAGTYSVTVTTNDNCSGTQYVTVTQVTQLQPEIGGELMICDGENTTLSPIESYDNYLWSNGLTTSNIDVSQGGIYAVTVSNSDGCSGIAEVSVKVNSLPTVTIEGATSFCIGGNTTLFITGDYETIQWSNGVGDLSTTVSMNGLYSVTVSDENGCTATDEAEAIAFNIPEFSIGGDLEICPEEETVLTVNGVFKEYQWSNAQTERETVVNQGGTYAVTVTDENGCTAVEEVTVVVNEPIAANIQGHFGLCIGSTTTLSLEGDFETIEWSNNSSESTIEVSEAGVYSVTTTDSNGCISMDEVAVIAITPPMPSIEGDLELCVGATTELSLNANYITIQWSTFSNSPSIIGVAGETYSVTVTNANGCTGIDEVELAAFALPEVNIGGDIDFCEGESSQLDGGEGFDKYLWSTSETTRFISVSEADTYSVEVTNSNDCTASDAVQVFVEALPNVEIVGSLSFCEGGNTSLSVNGNFEAIEWNTNETSSSIVVEEGGIYSVIVRGQNGCTNEEMVEVEERDALTPNIAGDLAFCEGGFTLLDAGPGYFSHSWSSGENSRFINVSEGGTYEVIVTDATDCSGSAEVTVTENMPRVPTIEGPNHFCVGETITLDAGEGFDEYTWNTGEKTRMITVGTNGQYTVDTKDENDCEASDMVMVEADVAAAPSIEGARQFCEDTETVLSVGNNDDYVSYQWSTGAITQSIVVTEAGRYEVTVVDENGCSAQNFANTNTVSAAPPTISGALGFCAEGNTTLAAPFGYSEYEWNTGEKSRVIIVAESGNYGVLVTDSNGCTASDLVNVEEKAELEVGLTGSLSICNGSSAILEVVGEYKSYEWDTGETSKAIEVDEAGIYSVIVTDFDDCTGMTSEEITVSDSLKPVISGNVFICNSEPNILDAGGGFAEYLWSNGATTRTIAVNESGDYSVVVSNEAGCTGMEMISLTAIPVFSPEISGNFDLCEGENTELLGEEGFESYLWSTGEIEQVIQVTEEGIYSLEVTDINGCIGFKEVVVSEMPSFEAEISGNLEIEPSETTILDAGAYSSDDGYLWSTGSTKRILVVNLPHNYRVTVTDINGCSSSAEARVELVSSIGELEVLEDLQVLPNPLNDFAEIQFTTFKTQQVQIELFGIEGRKLQDVYAGQVQGGILQSIEVDASRLPEGVYILQLQLDNDLQVYRRLIVMH